MNTTAYPSRPPYFAHKVTRLMVKTCLCQELGTGAFALLVTIAHTEDAAHYRRRVHVVLHAATRPAQIRLTTTDRVAGVDLPCQDADCKFDHPGPGARAPGPPAV